MVEISIFNLILYLIVYLFGVLIGHMIGMMITKESPSKWFNDDNAFIFIIIYTWPFIVLIFIGLSPFILMYWALEKFYKFVK